VRFFGVEPVVESPLHEMAGLITFSLACLALVGLSTLLRPRHESAPA
jgi:hypothetical protein